MDLLYHSFYYSRHLLTIEIASYAYSCHQLLLAVGAWHMPKGHRRIFLGRRYSIDSYLSITICINL